MTFLITFRLQIALIKTKPFRHVRMGKKYKAKNKQTNKTKTYGDQDIYRQFVYGGLVIAWIIVTNSKFKCDKSYGTTI